MTKSLKQGQNKILAMIQRKWITYALRVEMLNGADTLDKSRFLKKLNECLSSDSVIVLLGIYFK